jgi:tRNA threonylcarbamoyladenosine biosynthesis protein TsaE
MLVPHDFSIQHEVHNESGTIDLAQRLAAVIPNQFLIGLIGTLGAGKTRFTKALAEAAGVNADLVTSPTFVICQCYQGTFRLYHVDAYRIADEDEWYELGLDEKMDEDAVMLIEWSDRFSHLLPAERLDIQIEPTSETARLFTFTAQGANAAAVLRAMGH